MGTPDPTRDLEVFKLRRSGMSFADIAERVGLAGKSGAHLAYTRALQSWGPVIDDVESVKAEQIDRLEQMLGVYYSRASDTIEPDAKSAALVLSIQSQLSKLYGVDAAARAKAAETDGADQIQGVDDEVAKARARREAFRATL